MTVLTTVLITILRQGYQWSYYCFISTLNLQVGVPSWGPYDAGNPTTLGSLVFVKSHLALKGCLGAEPLALGDNEGGRRQGQKFEGFRIRVWGLGFGATGGPSPSSPIPDKSMFGNIHSVSTKDVFAYLQPLRT